MFLPRCRSPGASRGRRARGRLREIFNAEDIDRGAGVRDPKAFEIDLRRAKLLPKAPGSRRCRRRRGVVGVLPVIRPSTGLPPGERRNPDRVNPFANRAALRTRVTKGPRFPAAPPVVGPWPYKADRGRPGPAGRVGETRRTWVAAWCANGAGLPQGQNCFERPVDITRRPAPSRIGAKTDVALNPGVALTGASGAGAVGLACDGTVDIAQRAVAAARAPKSRPRPGVHPRPLHPADLLLG